MTLNFIFQKNSSGKHSAFARFSHKADIAKIPTGHVIENYDPVVWKKKKTISGNSAFNTLITEWKNRFEEYVIHCQKNSEHPTVPRAVQVTCKMEKLKDSKDFTLVDAFDAFVKFNSGVDGNKATTNERYECIKTLIKEYEGERRKIVYLNQIDRFFLRDLANHWVSFSKNGNGTLVRKLGIVKTVLRHAVGEGMMGSLPLFAKMKLDQPDSNRHSLTEEEYTKLKNHIPHSPEARVSLDAFLFSCETGLRISDIIKISPTSLIRSEGEYFIKFVMEKVVTKTPTVPLSDLAHQILKRHKIDQTTPYFAKLPVTISKKTGRVNAQAVNRMLKTIFMKAKLSRICEMVKISGKDKPVITQLPLFAIAHIHMGRHTAATLLLEQGIAATDLQKFLWHSKAATTEKYLHVNDKTAFAGIRAVLNRDRKLLVDDVTLGKLKAV